VFWVGSRFWLVLIEKSNAGFPAVNPDYGDKRSHLILAIDMM